MSLLTEEILKDVELKKLIDEEKATRLENEFEKNRNICKDILSIVHNRNDFPNFLRLFEYLTQRRNQSRESIISMVKNCLNEVLPSLKNNKDCSDLLQTIIKVTEGKIFVEFEYSQAIRKMTEIYLMNNEIDEAAKLIQDVQIEAFGSLDESDMREAINCAQHIGDNYLQEQAQGYSQPESFTHGTSEQRYRWFKKGLESGDPAAGRVILTMPYDQL